MSMFPLLTFDEIGEKDANACLERWEHKMGPLNRPFPSRFYALFHLGEPTALVAWSCLITASLGADRAHITRENAIELSRLCAARSNLCRVCLRLWREFIFPTLGVRYAVSYQDAKLHTGNTYRFDGWKRIGFSRSGTDSRSGLKGRNKAVWIWEIPAAA